MLQQGFCSAPSMVSVIIALQEQGFCCGSRKSFKINRKILLKSTSQVVPVV